MYAASSMILFIYWIAKKLNKPEINNQPLLLYIHHDKGLLATA